MNYIDPLIAEFEREAAATRRVLERVPEEKFGWRPHPKSMTMGRLATHVAETPGWLAAILEQDEMAFNPEEYKPKEAASRAELLQIFDDNMAMAAKLMTGQSNDHVMAMWRMKVGDQIAFEAPRIGVIRSMILNHTYHHRGQLTVYLRLNDIPVPSVYGPSADEQG